MYNAYFGFKEPPFSIAPDPRYLYMTAQHREALAHLVYGLNSDGGCILLTGEVGTGKTTICRCLLEQIPEKVNIALVLNPKISELELLETICDELGINYPEHDKTIKTFTDRINQYLIEHNALNERTVLIIDEAQNLSSEVLEQLRLLTNLETDQRKLLQIIILGQPELLDMLSRPELRQLAQRITARYHLKPLSREELKAYINHRLAIAGQNIQLFPEGSLQLLYKLSRGIPRLINVICDRALLGCYVENTTGVEPGILKKAAKEVFGELKQKQNKSGTSIKKASLIVLIVLIISGGFMFYNNSAILLPAWIKKNVSSPVTVMTPETAADPITYPAQTTPSAAIPDIPDKRTDSTTSLSAPDQADTGTETAFSGDTTHDKSLLPQADGAISDQVEKLKTFIKQSADNTKIQAYKNLFKQWKLHYDGHQTTACTQAKQAGLRCLHKQGNLNSLMIHNRPAVLKLINSDGSGRYATLTKVNGNNVKVTTKDSNIHITPAILDTYWLGQYTLLWHPPAGYRKPVLPGEKSKLVPWLKQSLSTLMDKEMSTAQRSGYYEGDIVEQVKQFQRQHNLSADGVVGPITLIHINTALGMKVPVLMQ